MFTWKTTAYKSWKTDISRVKQAECNQQSQPVLGRTCKNISGIHNNLLQTTLHHCIINVHFCFSKYLIKQYSSLSITVQTQIFQYHDTFSESIFANDATNNIYICQHHCSSKISQDENRVAEYLKLCQRVQKAKMQRQKKKRQKKL